MRLGYVQDAGFWGPQEKKEGRKRLGICRVGVADVMLCASGGGRLVDVKGLLDEV